MPSAPPSTSTWLRRGIPVQRVAGHKNLATTHHHVHYLKTDLEDAARRLNERGNTWATVALAP
jgi:hypothetical protein